MHEGGFQAGLCKAAYHPSVETKTAVPEASEAQDDPPDQGQSLVAQFSNRLLPDLLARWQDRLIASWQIEKLRCHVLPIPWRLSA